MPWRTTLPLQDDGWWLHSEVIWHKPNAHPESVKDRPSKAHQTVFLLSKSQDYYYDVVAVRGPNDRRLRTVWDINTEPRRPTDSGVDDHPAVMPMTLARQCVSITSEPGDVALDPYAGSGTTLLAARALGRRIKVGIELSPAFVDLIEHRLTLCATGRPLKRRIDDLSAMGAPFVARMVDSLVDPPRVQFPESEPTWITDEPDWIEYFAPIDLRSPRHHGGVRSGITSFETAFRNTCEAVDRALDAPGSSQNSASWT